MPDLKIQTGDGTVVPGQETAEKEQAEQRAQAEYDTNLLYKTDKESLDTGPDYTYSRIRIRKKDEVNIYAEEQDKRYATDSRLKKIIILAVACVAVLVIASILPTQIFDRAQFNLAIWLSELMTDFQNFIGIFVDPDTMYTTYVMTIIVTMLAGAAMALSGGVFQGSLRNALASPSTLGIMSGGSIGAIIYAVFVYPSSVTATFNGSYTELEELYNNMDFGTMFMEQFGGFLCSLLGCAIIVTLVMSIALLAGRGKVSNFALIVAGQVFTQVITLVLNWIRMWLENHGDEEMATYLSQAQAETFTGAYTIPNVLVFAIPLIICMVICCCMSGRLSLLAFNDDEARSMGISTTRMRNGMVAICTIMTALVVSFCGNVGFVGFMVPHIARRLVGPDFRYLLPTCALTGGLMVTAVFCVDQQGIPFLTSSSTGVVTSIIGCITFLIIALRGRRNPSGQWL